MDFLVSYTGEDRDWAEWIASHLGALGYSYALDDPAPPGEDPLAPVQDTLERGQHAIVVVSGAFVEALRSSGAPDDGRLLGPGRAVVVQIEPLLAPPDLRDGPTARMHEAADDYGTSRDLLMAAVRTVLPRPAGGAGTGGRRVGLPAPTALAEAYPVAAPPPAPSTAAGDHPDGAGAGADSGVDVDPARGGADLRTVSGPARSAGLLGADRHDQRGEPEPPSAGDRGADEGAGRPAEPDDRLADEEAGRPTEPDDRLVRLPQPRPALLWGRDDQLAALATGLTARWAEHDGDGQGARAEEPRPTGPADHAARRPVGTTTRSQLDSVTVGLVGPSGLGKSALAVELASREAGRLDVAWWFRGATRAMVGADARALAAALGAGDLAAGEAVAHVRDWLGHTDQRWLIVVDGVVDWDDVADLVPGEGRGQLLVTTSNPGLDARAGAPVLELPALDDTTATAFLLARTSRSDQSGARRVAERLGGSPAALELAACYARTSGVSFAAYLTVLDGDDRDRVPPEAPPEVSAPVTTVEAAVVAALRAADRARPGAAVLLPDLAATTADAPIPRAVVDAIAGDHEPGTAELLAAWGLLLVDDAWVVIPPAIRQALAYLVPGAPGAEASARLASALADAAGDPASPTADAVLPHAARLVGSTPRPAASPALARAAALTTAWADRQGALDEAVALAERSLDLHRRTAGEGDPALVEARRVLSDLYVRQAGGPRGAARPGEASPALGAGDTAGLVDEGDGHPRVVLGTPADLVAPPTTTGPADTTAPAFPSVPVDAAVPGDPSAPAAGPVAGSPHGANADHATAPVAGSPPGANADPAAAPVAGSPADQAGATVGADTAAADGEVGPQALAAELARLEATAGAASVEAISARHHLALAQGEAGAHAEAVALLQAVVADCETHFGPDHLDTLTARANLASAHAAAGDHAAAIAGQERVVADHERLLGSDDALTLTARNQLANGYALAGRYQEALVQHEGIVADYLRTQGPAHGATLTAQHNLANTYADLGRHDEALELRLQVLERRLGALGPEHPQTLGARNNLANSYADLGRHQEALDLRAEVLAHRERLLGPEHPQTLGARNNLANSYADLGRHNEALALRLEVLAERERLLRADHPHTLTARNNLANSYAALGRHDEALELRRRALRDCERVLGPDHPHTLTARTNLAGTQAALGDDPQAANPQGTPSADPEPLPPPPPIPPSLAERAQGPAQPSLGEDPRPGSGNGTVDGDRAVGAGGGARPARGRTRRFWFWRR